MVVLVTGPEGAVISLGVLSAGVPMPWLYVKLCSSSSASPGNKARRSPWCMCLMFFALPCSAAKVLRIFQLFFNISAFLRKRGYIPCIRLYTVLLAAFIGRHASGNGRVALGRLVFRNTSNSLYYFAEDGISAVQSRLTAMFQVILPAFGPESLAMLKGQVRMPGKVLQQSCI